MQTLKGHTDLVNCLVVLPNGNLGSGSDDKTIKIWNINNGSVLKTFTGHSNWVTTLAVLANNISLASGSADKTIRFWNLI